MGEIHQLQFVCVKDADVIVYLYLDNWLSTFTSECSLGFFLLETAQNKESNSSKEVNDPTFSVKGSVGGNFLPCESSSMNVVKKLHFNILSTTA